MVGLYRPSIRTRTQMTSSSPPSEQPRTFMRPSYRLKKKLLVIDSESDMLQTPCSTESGIVSSYPHYRRSSHPDIIDRNDRCPYEYRIDDSEEQGETKLCSYAPWLCAPFSCGLPWTLCVPFLIKLSQTMPAASMSSIKTTYRAGSPLKTS
jgi:hypothetical protein